MRKGEKVPECPVALSICLQILRLLARTRYAGGRSRWRSGAETVSHLLKLKCGLYAMRGARQAGQSPGNAERPLLREVQCMRVSKLCQFVQIAAIHHVPGCKGVTQIVEPEVMDIGSFE